VTQGRIRGLERLRLEFGACASRLASLDAVVAEAGLKLGHGFVCLRSHAASELLVRRACERFTPDVVDERAAQPDQRVRRFRPGPSRSKPGSARAPGGPHAGDFADASRSLAPPVSGRGREPLMTFEPPSSATAVPPRADHQARRSASPWRRCRRCARARSPWRPRSQALSPAKMRAPSRGSPSGSPLSPWQASPCAAARQPSRRGLTGPRAPSGHRRRRADPRRPAHSVHPVLGGDLQRAGRLTCCTGPNRRSGAGCATGCGPRRCR
jgi:hypothetical protein